MLQQQFGQVAAATAASMALKPSPAAGQAPAKQTSVVKKSATKTASKTTSKAPTKTNTKKTS
jgi:hypothetical protein